MRAMRIVSCLACAALAREEPASPGLEGRRIEEPPWLAPNNTDAFVFGKHVERSLAKRRAAYRDAVLAGPATVAADVRAALARGVAWNAFGVSFPRGWDFASRASEALAAACVAPTTLQAAIFDFDHRDRSRAAPPPLADGVAAARSGEDLAAALAGDGFARVDDWGLAPDAFAAIAAAVARAPLAASAPGVLVADLANETALRPWSSSPTLAAALDGYFGPGAWVRTSATALELTDALTSQAVPSLKGYLSAMWHHDRCGSRVKAFLFLHDVGRHGRPTLVAPRSHRTLYYDHESLHASRFSESYVRDSYDVAALTGPEGGGALLDTNSVHRAEPDGARPRTVVILDHIARGKRDAYAALNFTGPCGQPVVAKPRTRKPRRDGGPRRGADAVS